LSAGRATTLQSCALIAAEDTRHTGTFFQMAFRDQTPQLSLHDHNEGTARRRNHRAAAAGRIGGLW
jgi:16S rRNA C1402 (ribose-2'-O) methylase RsmI